VFADLKVRGWRQYRAVEIEFHPRLTVITGANGSGKTTLLNVLNRHFGWPFTFLSTPLRSEGGQIRFSSALGRRRRLDDNPSVQNVGSLSYRNGAVSRIFVPTEVTEAAYNITLEFQQAVNGLFIPSHRPPFFYQRIDQIPTSVSARAQLFEAYVSEQRSRFTPGSARLSPSARLKESLVSLATFGYPSRATRGSEEAVATYEGFEAILRVVLPKAIRFRQLSVRTPEVVLETDTGDFSLDAVSGGTAAIIDLAWQIYLCSLVYEDFVVVIDEPENHLHPELSRTLLRDLLEAFPGTQFVVATHNPFMVTSVPSAYVYALFFDGDGRVQSTQLDLQEKAASSSDVLRDVLGVPSTMPVWVDEAVARATQRFEREPVTEQGLRDLRGEMDRLGLAHLFPETLTSLIPGSDDQA
jgi:predicted ATPase